MPNDYVFGTRTGHADECFCDRCVAQHGPTVKHKAPQLASLARGLMPMDHPDECLCGRCCAKRCPCLECESERLSAARAKSPKMPQDSAARKAMPMFSGLIAYFPLALAAVAKHSKESNDKHNPGEPLHWSREKSSDHMDCIVRHVADYSLGDQHALVAIAWRSLAQLELDEEAKSAAGQSSGERARG